MFRKIDWINVGIFGLVIVYLIWLFWLISR